MSNEDAVTSLKPCPFCGSKPEFPDGIGTQYEIECDCGMAGASVQISDLMTLDERQSGWDSVAMRFAAQYVERAKEEAIAAWNRRAPTAEQAEGVRVLTADDADMVWPDYDTETFHHSIDEAVEYEVDQAEPADGELELKVQLAKRIPTATIRIFNITESGHEWEIVADPAASTGEQA